MESNNNPRTVLGVEPAAPLTGANFTSAGDWRSQIQPEQRQKIIRRIIDILKKLLPLSGQDGPPVPQLESIAVKFEEKIYAVATSQSDYLKRISTKMLNMEKSQTSVVSLQHNSASVGEGAPDPGQQSQVHNQEEPLSIPMINQPQEQQQILYQNNGASNGVPNSISLSSGHPPGHGFSQAPLPNVIGQNSSSQNIQNVPSVALNSVGSSIGPGMPPNAFGNSQRQMQPRQQQALPQQQQVPSQNPQQYLYQKQLQHQLMKQKYQQGSINNSPMPSEIQQYHHQQQQSSIIQSPLSNLQQNQPSSVQQSTQSMHQQYPQPVKQQQQQQAPTNPQQQASISRHAMLAIQKQQQQQQLIRQQPHRAMQQNQLSEATLNSDKKQQQKAEEKQVASQQNNVSELHPQHLLDQQGYLPNMHQQQVVSTQFSTPGMGNNQQSIHMPQKSKIPIQQQIQQNATALLPTQVQQSHSQQQLVPQCQTKPAETQQVAGLQQQTNSLQRDVQQRLQTPSMSSQEQNLVEQQKQPSQTQPFPGMPSNSMSQTGSVNEGDWREEVYQKIKTLKDAYFAGVAELYQKISAKLKQQDSLPHQLNHEQIQYFKACKITMERLLQFLQLSKSQLQPADREKVGICEQKILRLLQSRSRNPVSSLQRGPQLNMQAMQQKLQQESHNSQMQSRENQVNPRVQQVNLQPPAGDLQQNNWASMQHASMNSASSLSSSFQHMTNTPQPTSSLELAQLDAQNSLQHVAINPLQQTLSSGSQRPSTLQSQMNTVQANLDTLQPKSNLIQYQHLKQQEGKISQTKPLRQQLQAQGQMHQQLLHKQQQHPAQLSARQMSQFHQIPGSSDLKQHHSAVQQTSFYHQKLKSGQVLPASSPEVSQHSSPLMDQNQLKSLMQSNSPLIAPSPSTPLAPSPMPMESEKNNSGLSTTSHAGIIGHQQATIAPVPTQSLAIVTLGMSASPLLADLDQQSVVEQPHERLMRLVKSTSARALSASISDISSVVTTVDRIAGSAPGKGSRAAVGEDLAAMTNCRLQAGDSHTHHQFSGMRKIKRYTSGEQSNVVSSAGSVNDYFSHLNGAQASDSESTATSPIKRLRAEANNALVEEIRDINRRLIDTVVDISEQESDSSEMATATEGCGGAIIKCSFNPVALSPNLKLPYSSAQLSPIQPLRLLVPNNYPNCSPIFLDKFPVEISDAFADFSMKAKTRFSTSLRSLSQPLSLGEIARTWDICARAVISEYAQQSGGGSFSSKYGTWESCLNAA